jgi:carboxypeptidase PM20D1
VEILDPGIESPVSDWKSRPFALVEEAVASIFKGVVSSPYIMTGASDARFMGILSDHCLRFAPFHITDEQLSSIHGINENVDVDALAPAVEFYKYVIQHFQGSAS